MGTPLDLLIRGAELVTPHTRFRADIAIHGGRFAWVGAIGTFAGEAVETLDATGLTALPGLIDSHVHFREPGAHAHKATYVSESLAAAAGGVTSVLTMPNTSPFTDSAERLSLVEACAAPACIDAGFHFMVTPDNLDEMLAVTDRVVAYKLYLNETTGISSPLADVALLERLLATGLRFSAHAEADTLDLLLDCHRRCGSGPLYIVHVALAREVASLRAAKAAGQWVYAEASPHHLFLDESDARRLGPFGDMRPTLKSPADVAALWEAVADGTIDTIATDHAPHLREEKLSTPVPPGVPGVQTMLPLLLDAVHAGRLTLEHLVRLTSRNPADIFMLGGKGCVRVGKDADLVLVDPAAQQTIRHADQLTKPGWTPFDGRTVYGTVLQTFARGRCVFSRA